jgi:hypothetical protein
MPLRATPTVLHLGLAFLFFWQKAQIVLSSRLAIGVCIFGNLAKRGLGLAYMRA